MRNIHFYRKAYLIEIHLTVGMLFKSSSWSVFLICGFFVPCWYWLCF